MDDLAQTISPSACSSASRKMAGKMQRKTYWDQVASTKTVCSGCTNQTEPWWNDHLNGRPIQNKYQIQMVVKTDFMHKNESKSTDLTFEGGSLSFEGG